MQVDIKPLFERLFPDSYRDWKVDALNSAKTGDLEIRLRPNIYSLFSISEMKMARFNGDKYALVDHLKRNLFDMMNSIVDDLDKSIGRPKRVDHKPHGTCNYCGAPY